MPRRSEASRLVAVFGHLLDQDAAAVRRPCRIEVDEATSPVDGEARLRRLVTDLERQYPSAAACLAEDLPALCTHLAYPLRLRKRLRSTNLLERSLEEVKRRTKVIGRFPGETSCLSFAGPCWTCSLPALADSRSPPWSTGNWRRCVPPGRSRRRSR